MQAAIRAFGARFLKALKQATQRIDAWPLAPNMLRTLQRMTWTPCGHRHHARYPTLRYGNAVLTRFPKHAVRTLDLSFTSR